VKNIQIQLSKYHPDQSPFCAYLADLKPIFGKLNDAKKVYLIEALMSLSTRQNEHHERPGTYTMFFQPRYKAFGNSERFGYANDALGNPFVKVETHNHFNSLAAGWILDSKWKREVLYNFYTDERLAKNIGQSFSILGEPKSRFRSGIATKKGTNSDSNFIGLKVPYKIYYDFDGLVSTLRHFEKLSDNNSENIVAGCHAILNFTFKDDHGFYTHMQYKESLSGRLFTCGKQTLQNVPSIVKDSAFRGCWEYDFDNAHYEILRQLGNQYGLPTEYISAYCQDKAAFREKVAKANKISVKSAKTILLSIIYGAKITLCRSSAIFKAVQDDMGMDEEEVSQVIESMKSDREFMQFVKEVKCLKNEVFERGHFNQRGRFFDYKVFNILGNEFCLLAAQNKRTSPGKYFNPKASAVAHLLQGCEAYMLREVLKLHGKDVALLQHDGWILRSDIDVEKLQDHILSKTGFSMKISKRFLN
jgi:hypothetical protein